MPESTAIASVPTSPTSAREPQPEFDDALLSPLGRIRKRLQRDLPRLREQYPNMWIAYDANGMAVPPNPDVADLDQQCLDKGLKGDEFAVENTFPEPEYITEEAIF